ncbi:ATP-binding protein [Streptomyces sp. P38-E01]|uniref:ATP-binding protein n=1 Tax=Streptomyces tardus TaxID=2780544 RepID=A0A949JQ67_9ACTN|nr:ATP-binding protein [Streptomyces tardus]MBU7599221.1 ATP-binding protein [Streptomyces tardus]
MSFTRRIAKSALLTAAGAASVVGAAAGSAQAVDLPKTPDLGGVSNLDGAAQGVTDLAGETGADLVNTTLPAEAGAPVDSLTRSGAPAVEATDVLDTTVSTVTEGIGTRGLDSTPAAALDSLPLSNASIGGLPVQGLPLG